MKLVHVRKVVTELSRRACDDDCAEDLIPMGRFVAVATGLIVGSSNRTAVQKVSGFYALSAYADGSVSLIPSHRMRLLIIAGYLPIRCQFIDSPWQILAKTCEDFLSRQTGFCSQFV